MYSGLAGKVVAVTGGAQGIGESICDLFIEHGVAVIILDIDARKGRTTSERLSTKGNCRWFGVDIADEASVQDAMRFIKSEFGGLDILVNNASAFIMRGIDATTSEWRRMLDVNVMGSALCAKYAVPMMRERGGGAIVNISSISAFVAQPGLLTYSTTKAAVSNLTRLMAMEMAPDNIRVNAVCPGTVWSENNAAVIRKTMGLDRDGANAHPDVGGKSLLKRVADPREIANAVLFLASSDASFITAENLVVDGGYTAI